MNERLRLYSVLRRYHNVAVGTLTVGAFLLTILVQHAYFRPYATSIRPYVSALFVLDGIFVLTAFLLLPRTHQERAIIADMSAPLLLLVAILGFVLPTIRVFTDLVNVLPYWPLAGMLIGIPMWYLWVGQSAYWGTASLGRNTEGQAIQALVKKLTATGFGGCILLLLYWLSVVVRIGFQNLRLDLFPLFVTGVVLTVLAGRLDIKINWLERHVSKREALFGLLAVIGILLFLIFYMRGFDDWLSFHIEWYLLLIIYINILPAYMSILHDWPSRRLLTFVIIGTIPIFALFVGMLVMDSGVVQKTNAWFTAHREQFFSGLIWFFGAMVGSAIFSAIVSIVGKKKRQQGKPSLNTATIDDILQTRAMTRPVAEAIMHERPFSGSADLSSRVHGVGSARASALAEKFKIP
jgi:hypothetical protein